MKDAKGVGPSRAIWTSMVAGLGVLGVATLFATAGLVVAPRRAAALPSYAQKTGKPCGYCHVKASGGGALTAAGKRYQANGHKF